MQLLIKPASVQKQKSFNNAQITALEPINHTIHLDMGKDR